MHNDFYVYMYLDLSGAPFYIGKGRGYRHKYYDHTSPSKGPIQYVGRKLLKIGTDNVRTHFLHKNLTEDAALFWERYWIDYIGRVGRGGQLCNLIDGGGRGGGTGVSPSLETRRKLSEALIGRKHSAERRKNISVALTGRVGTPCSDEAKRKISAANTGRIHGPMPKEVRDRISATMKRHWSMLNELAQ